MKTLEELKLLIIEWAKERDLIHKEIAPKQKLKLIEECGELASAILKNDIKLQKDAIGDIFVVLVILSEQLRQTQDFNFEPTDRSVEFHNIIKRIITEAVVEKEALWISFHYLNRISLDLKYELTECANIAWNEIKNRTGKTVNGTFIKD